MRDVAKFIQLFRYDLTDKDHDSFERITINTNFIHMVEWHEDWDFVAIVCKTDHPCGEENFIEDYGDPIKAQSRYIQLMALLGANSEDAFDQEEQLRKTAFQNKKDDDFFRHLFDKAKAAGWDPRKDRDQRLMKEIASKDECKDYPQNCTGCASCPLNEPEEAEEEPDTSEDAGEEAEVSADGCTEAPAESEGHLD